MVTKKETLKCRMVTPFASVETRCGWPVLMPVNYSIRHDFIVSRRAGAFLSVENQPVLLAPPICDNSPLLPATPHIQNKGIPRGYRLPRHSPDHLDPGRTDQIPDQ